MPKPRLYIFIGSPGSGKTTIAKFIAEATGAKHLWADGERHKLFKNPTHSEKESNELYRQLNDAAEYLLAQGKSVIYDTNFNFYEDRQLMREIANGQNADTVLVWVTTDNKVARQRAVHPPEMRNGYMIGMTAEQFDAITSKLESPRANEKAIKIDGSTIDKQRILKQLDLG